MIPPKTTKFIAEVSSNHHRNLNRCLEFIDCAANIGCDAVKFQLFKIDELFAPEILNHSARHRARRQWELPVEFLPDLAARCREKQVHFSCTPFYLKAVEELLPFVDFFKIASYELLWDDLLTACAQTGKPVVLSTGMATLDEIKHAVSILNNAGCVDLTLLHCVSDYPAAAGVCNLSMIEELRKIANCPAGWSDHSVAAGVIYNAVFGWGATMVEFHLDLEGKGAEFDAGHCWLPQQIETVIRNVKTGFLAGGNGVKQFSTAELQERDWRADPADGLRPFKKIRQTFNQPEVA
jgi:N-acetylneuraminate synthase